MFRPATLHVIRTIEHGTIAYFCFINKLMLFLSQVFDCQNSLAVFRTVLIDRTLLDY
jgi:hypothetical protein